jgi:hypothetical protein
MSDQKHQPAGDGKPLFATERLADVCRESIASTEQKANN